MSISDMMAGYAVDAVMVRLNRAAALAAGVPADDYDDGVIPASDTLVTALLPLAPIPAGLAALVAAPVADTLAAATDVVERVTAVQANPALAPVLDLDGVTPGRLTRLLTTATVTITAFAPANVTAAVNAVQALGGP